MEQDRLREETQLNQARFMVEIEASRRAVEEQAQVNEELRKANEQLQRNMHCKGQCPT